jgi:hypothetical protein
MNCTTPILLLAFNRPASTRQVFEEIRKIKPERLYLASDGPRISNSSDSEKVEEVRKYLLSSVDWPCEVKTLFRNENVGCGKAVSSALSWFFEQVEDGIILEDDCLPHPEFFPYCEEMLNRYRMVEKVKFIGGANFQDGTKMGEASYYFSMYNHVWGWASWRRVWKQYNYTLNGISWSDLQHYLRQQGFREDEIVYWEEIFTMMKINPIDTWDYQLTFSTWHHAGLSIIPNVNLVSNIGFGEGATHTKDRHESVSNIKTCNIFPIVHAKEVKICRKADRRFFNRKIRPSLAKRIKMKAHTLSHRLADTILNKRQQ